MTYVKYKKAGCPGDRVLLPAVQHSGSYYTAWVINKPPHSKLKRSGHISGDGRVIHGHPDDTRFDTITGLSKRLKTVIPLRHPAFIAVSWKKRGPQNWRTENFLVQWERLETVDGFRFPIETKPFDELEEYLGAKVNRLDRVIHSIGEYNEKKDLQAARDYLGEDWALVEKALDTITGRQYYAADLRGV